ncbi:histidinol-phosphate transaminase [Corynebacterium sp. sy017]|uniref:histidinol-phosphate transaminase n=1 Tax=unclassified Corynebacterium TaxID=2624378 RepID=UPI0011863FC9|nr:MULTISPECIES: histidinol-phosphate transaminase [unclassified Corynebacterium]MBP3088468.1 histidinol-phosphate transaminase [Corynebacterium sp. sy017]TSD92089.1 histidinol-phosphate transaminase [Corynebacterium sp. SY003]
MHQANPAQQTTPRPLAHLDSIPTYSPGARSVGKLKLSSNEPSFPPLEQAVVAMTEAVGTVNRYPDMASVELREALAQHLGLTVAEVAVGCGSSALCQGLVQICAGPGDEVIFPWRSFEAYPIFTTVTGATSVPIALTSQLRNDLEAMAAAITQRTKLIFVCNPNNPTGTTISRQDFERFLAAVPPHIIIALDEAYIEFMRDPDSPQSLDYVRDYPNVIGVRTFSKAYGLAGLRVGYALGNPQLIDALNKVALPFGVNAVAQAGAVASLAAAQELLARTEVVVEQRERAALALGAAPSESNFIWLPTQSAQESQELAAAFAEHDILVRSFPEGVRITITDAQETQRLLAAWEKIRH